MKKNFIPLVLTILVVSACTPVADEPATPFPDMNQPVSNDETPTPQVDLPAPTVSNLARGNAYLESAELLTLESYPLQFMLVLKGNLPTPCNQLRVDVNPPDAENKINVEVYSMTDPDRICAQMLAPFEENVPLGSFPAGHYFLLINGELLTEFDA